MFEDVKNDLLNFPDEVIRGWLLDYAETIGWPPTHERWLGILYGRPLEFWQAVSWEKRVMDFLSIRFSNRTIDIARQVKSGHTGGARNAYTVIPGGQQRFLRALKYIFETGSFPSAMCLLEEQGVYSVVDGNHRFAAWLSSRELMDQLNRARAAGRRDVADTFQETLARRWNIHAIAPFNPAQEVWVASFPG